MDTVNVLSPELRTKVRKEVPFLEGAWVDFWDDLTMNDILTAQNLKSSDEMKEWGTLLIKRIAEWNFSDGIEKMEITLENMYRLPMKLLLWLIQEGTSFSENVSTDKKKELSNS